MSKMINPPVSLPADFIGVHQVATRFKLPKSSLYLWIRTGKIPKPERHHTHYSGWSLAELMPILKPLLKKRRTRLAKA